jgi:UDP-glucose 4-epimerase
LKALDYEGSGAFNISTGKETTNIDVFKQIEYFLKTGIKPKYGPSRAGDIFRSSLSSSKAKKFLKWKSAVNFKNGVKKTIEYYE